MNIKKKIVVPVATAFAILGGALNAFAETETTTIQHPYDVYYMYTFKTDYVDTKHKTVVPGTYAQHRKGIRTTIATSRTETVSTSASTEFCGEVGTAFARVSAKLSVSMVATKSVSTSVSYSISAGTKNGKYRMVVRYPGKKVTCKRTIISRGNVVENNKTVDTVNYAPTARDAYTDIERYAN